MLKRKRIIEAAVAAGMVTLTAAPAFARGISLKEGGTLLWIFLGIGAIIVLLQLIPAAILFFSFIGTTTEMLVRGKKAEAEAGAEEKEVAAAYEPAKAEG